MPVNTKTPNAHIQSQTQRCSAVILSLNSQTWLIPHKSRFPQPVNINKNGHFSYYLWQLKTPFIKPAGPQPPSLGILQGGGVLCTFPESVDLCFLRFRPSISTLSTGHLGQLPVAIYSFRVNTASPLLANAAISILFLVGEERQRGRHSSLRYARDASFHSTSQAFTTDKPWHQRKGL